MKATNVEKMESTTITDRFWSSAQHIISATEHHPFLESMVRGTLANEKFKYYVVQDALFLADFAECLQRLSQNSDMLSTEDSAFLERLAKGTKEEEMKLHNSFFTEWGIAEESKKAKATPNTILYTSYMLRVVATQDHAEGLAVLLPCFWVYMHVGKCMLSLREKLGASVKRSRQYDAWIDMYGGDEFEQEVLKYIEMVNRVAANVSQEKVQRMEDHFLMSCMMEHMFWDQAIETLSWPVFERK